MLSAVAPPVAGALAAAGVLVGLLAVARLGAGAVAGERRRRVVRRLHAATTAVDGVTAAGVIGGGLAAGPIAGVLAGLPPAVRPVAVAASLGAVVGVALDAPALGLAGLLTALGLAVVRVGLGRRRGAGRPLAEVADLLAARLGAGAAPAEAVAAVAGVADDGGWRTVLDALGRGEPLQGSVDAWASARGPDAALLADAWAVAGETGASASAALARAAATLRERDALGREIDALCTQARLSARVLTVVPVGFAALVAALDGRVARFALATTPGRLCLLTGLLLDRAGAAWMRRSVEQVR